MRVVLDTNVFISSVLGGALAEVLDRCQAGQFTLVVTGEIVHEYLVVLRRPKFALPVEVIDTLIGYVFHRAEFVVPAESWSPSALIRTMTSFSRPPWLVMSI